MRLFLAITTLSAGIAFTACKKKDNPLPVVVENINDFREVSSITLAGGAGAAEISTYDPTTKRLFTVNNGAAGNVIDVIDLATPANPVKIHSINIATYGGFVNSVDVYNGKLAAAIEATVKQDNGKVVVFNTSTYAEIKTIVVGALPDMVTYSKDGKYILTANEGEPNATYTIDPVGSISIIDVNNNYTATTIDFSGFASQAATLKAQGFRILAQATILLKT